ncbi:hypothetical protein ACH0BF_16455 [Pseudobacillus sp. 179-B 2D1 NHS]|uniref:hypothetical protein n=1 Tax=Pseudobacillus sp. 179-B 2D1 NHS TaxID=3374292 RepID=UPI003879F5EE
MAMFQDSKFVELEEQFSCGVEVKNEGHSFSLTLVQKNAPLIPEKIIDYNWKVTLADGFEFRAPMGSAQTTYPPTRLENIINALKKAGKYDDPFLAHAINDTIDEIYRKYS